jgi:hypothetical protein
MTFTVLESKEDLAWAKQVHGLPNVAKYAVLYGNEDSPYVIEFWCKRRPLWNDPSEKFDPESKAVLA